MIRDRKFPGALALVASLLLAPATASLADDPTATDIANKMTGVVDDLGKKKTGTPVQNQQTEIVSDLDALIAKLEKECENCKNGIKKNNPRSGMKESEIRSGTGGAGDLNNPNDGGKDWNQLSTRERDRILQSMSEGFPPEYRTVLERYYRRLAEEKAAKDKKDAPKSAPSNAKP